MNGWIGGADDKWLALLSPEPVVDEVNFWQFRGSSQARAMIPERSDPPEKIYGVGFSGAAEADKKIRIASGVVEKGLLPIEACFRGGELWEERPVGIHPFRNMSWTTFLDCPPDSADGTHQEKSSMVKEGQRDPIISAVSPKPQQC